MLEFRLLKDLNDYVKTYRNYPLPVILCDKELEVYWSNALAKSLYPHLTESGGLAEALREFPAEGLFEGLEKQGSVTLSGVVPMSAIRLALTPVFREGEIVGMALTVISQEDAGGAQAIYTASKSAELFGGSMRGAVSSIFEEMDSLALKADFAGAGWIKAGLNRISLDSYRILRLTGNIVEFAGHQSGATTPSFERVDVNGYFDLIEEALLAMSKEIGLPLRIHRPPGASAVHVDKNLIQTALVNLLHNSFYYTRPGNEVDLTVAVEEETAAFTVADRGLGIPKAHHDRVFHPYRTGPNESAGLGLGLALVKAAAHFHHGSVAIESEPGVGTSVAITLPRYQPLGPQSLGRGGDDLDVKNRFSRMYTGLADAAASPFRG